MARSEACQLFIEQQIEEGLQEGKTPYSIGKALSAWVEQLFLTKIPATTLEKRAERQRATFPTNVGNTATSQDYSYIQENQVFEHGGQREGAGRPGKYEAPPVVVSEEVHNHRAQGTGENEWYTPPVYIGTAKEVLGTIDLDPASSAIAQESIQATHYFTIAEDGLTKPWFGKVWLNPPYSQPAISNFVAKAVNEYSQGNVKEMIVLTHNYTDTAWFHMAASKSDCICFTKGRIGFLSPDGTKAAPTQGQAFFYYGSNTDVFALQFSKHGLVVRRHLVPEADLV